jgi:AraC-like DNA-binding protein
MRFQFIKPTGFLAQYIRHYWILEAEDSDGEICERVIPTGNIQWMFHYKKTFVIKNSGKLVKQPRSLVSGISSNFSDVATCGESGVIAVTFYPHGASHFLNFPLSEIENASIDLEDIFNTKVKPIEEQICTVNTLAERIGIIERFLLNCFKPINNNDFLLIKKGVALINQRKGQINASELAGMLLYTNKSLERKFSALLGKTPKQFIRIVRFQRIIQSFSIPGNKHLTQLAYENGYFDQAHFVKDFKSLSGYTPKEFIALGPCQADYFE